MPKRLQKDIDREAFSQFKRQGYSNRPLTERAQDQIRRENDKNTSTVFVKDTNGSGPR
jgi:hypothetical protein